MGRLFIEYITQDCETDSQGKGQAANLQNQTNDKEEKREGQLIFTCKSCGIHLADSLHFISKDFRGKTGTAFLFSKV